MGKIDSTIIKEYDKATTDQLVRINGLEFTKNLLLKVTHQLMHFKKLLEDIYFNK